MRRASSLLSTWRPSLGPRHDCLRSLVSEQIGQPQPDYECWNDRNSNKRKHPVPVRHSVSSNAPGVLSAVAAAPIT
jgi:hypothetical protein